MSDGETNFADSEAMFGSFMEKGLTFKLIVLFHLMKISRLSCVEFRGGYYDIKEKPINSGAGSTIVETKVYVPDSREVYCNAVECLSDMLLPYFDEDMANIEFNLRKSQIKAWAETTIPLVYEDESRYDEEYKREYQMREFKSEEAKQNYREAHLLIARDLFRALSKFLYRKKYLNVGGLEN